MVVTVFGSGIVGAISPPLFPELDAGRVPERPEWVRLELSDSAPDRVEIDAVHLRGGGVVFASKLFAERSLDPRSGEEALTVLRIDDDCLEGMGDLSPWEHETCSSMRVVETDRGVHRFVYHSRFFGYQVQFTLVEEVDRPEEWRLVPTGRLGEPLDLRARYERGTGDEARVVWSLANEDRERSISRELWAEVPAQLVVEGRLEPIELAAIAAVDFFYDLADFYVHDWVLYRQDQVVDEGIPSPEENDPSQCELVDVCGAEFETCLPTPNGWLGCNIDSGIFDWGGGFGRGEDGGGGAGGGGGGGGSGGGGGGGGVPQDPDWRVGSALTDPRAPLPLFHGLVACTDPTMGLCLEYDITSVLQRRETVGKDPCPQHCGLSEGGHMVFVYLTRELDDDPNALRCGEVKSDGRGDGVAIPVRDAVRYPRPGQRRIPCSSLQRDRSYVLRYQLDPYNLWFEGDGESNNSGTFRGLYFHQ